MDFWTDVTYEDHDNLQQLISFLTLVGLEMAIFFWVSLSLVQGSRLLGPEVFSLCRHCVLFNLGLDCSFGLFQTPAFSLGISDSLEQLVDILSN